MPIATLHDVLTRIPNSTQPEHAANILDEFVVSCANEPKWKSFYFSFFISLWIESRFNLCMSAAVRVCTWVCEWMRAMSLGFYVSIITRHTNRRSNFIVLYASTCHTLYMRYMDCVYGLCIRSITRLYTLHILSLLLLLQTIWLPPNVYAMCWYTIHFRDRHSSAPFATCVLGRTCVGFRAFSALFFFFFFQISFSDDRN